MTTFQNKTFLKPFQNKACSKNDDYMTPKSAWKDIQHLIPKDKVIWECFWGDSTSGKNLESLGFQVIHKPVDFFNNNLGDILVSNCPFSKKKQVFTRLKELEKPFVMICPSSMINTQYIRKLFGFGEDNKLQIIIPKKRIQFITDGKSSIGRCYFDCFYYCYKMNLPDDIIWLE